MEEKEGNKTISESRVSFLQRKKKWFGNLPKFKKVLVVFAGVGLLFVLYIISVLVRYNDPSISGKPTNEDLGKNRFESFPLQENGLVCFGDNNFSFRSDTPYSILLTNKEGVALVTKGVLLTVAKSEGDAAQAIEAKLKQYKIPFTKDGEQYIYILTPPQDAQKVSQSVPPNAVSVAKNNFAISIFYRPPISETQAQTILGTVLNSIKGGCSEK